MDELYSLCRYANTIKFDASKVLDDEKDKVIESVKNVYSKYENEVASSNVFYDLLVDVQYVLNRLGYKCIYELNSCELYVIIEGICLSGLYK